MIIMEKEIKIRQLSTEEIVLEPEDLQMIMTLGVTLSGTYHNLLSLKEFLMNDPRYRVIYKSISSTHLRVVKITEYDEFLEWKDFQKKNK